MPDDDDPRQSAKQEISPFSVTQAEPRLKTGPLSWLKDLLRGKASNSNEVLQEALEEYIEELKDADNDDHTSDNQKELITNVLNTRDLQVEDIMVPRADIIAIEEKASIDDIKRIFQEKQFSRLPLYRENLDNIIGTIHIKDILGSMLNGTPYTLAEIMREPLIVSPSLYIMELFKLMRDEKKHLALVVDEHGGIDGLVTLTDVMESIVGDIEDEFDHDDTPQIVERPDGSLVVDARLDIEEFEDRYGNFLSPEEREDIETLAGLAFSIAGHIPKKGETLKHSSGLTLDVTDADARRVKVLRIRNLQAKAVNDEV